jgi:uncharacterized protein YjeT (DUF2065 family)
MTKFSLPRLILSILSALILIGLINHAAFAADHPSRVEQLTNNISLDEPKPIEMGQSFILSGTLKDLTGNPIVDKPIFLSLNGDYLGQTTSDRNGKFSREFRNSLNAGIYKITAENNREDLFLETAASAYLSILPTSVQVQITPAIPDVGFMMDGRIFYTNDEGLATILINEPGIYRLFVLDDEYEHPNQRIELGRWTEEIYQPHQDIKVPTNKIIQVGINVFQIFSMDFVDLDGNPVDPSRITEFMIRSLQGDVFVLNNGEPRWFPASRTARRLTGLEETKLYYSVIHVIVDGSNVVNQSQQRFYTSPGGNLKIELILYSLKVNAKDGLFGWKVGESLLLEYPDGRIEEFPLDENGSVSIDSLARGTYYLNISGVKGLDNRIPVAMSRNQEVNMKIITYFDIAVFVGFGLLFVIGLLFYGRPWLWKSMVKSVQTTSKKLPSLPTIGIPWRTKEDVKSSAIVALPVMEIKQPVNEIEKSSQLFSETANVKKPVQRRVKKVQSNAQSNFPLNSEQSNINPSMIALPKNKQKQTKREETVRSQPLSETTVVKRTSTTKRKKVT